MSEKTKIAWADSTVNWWEGCTKVSAGCANCYAEARDRRFTGGKLWGVGAPRRKSKSAVKDALRYNKLPWICGCTESAKTGGFSRDIQFEGDAPLCCECGHPCHRRRIFSLSLGDIWDNEVPIEWLAEALNTIRQCDQVTWMLCSKRWENFFPRIIHLISWLCGKSPSEMDSDFYHWLMDWRTSVKIPTNIIGLCSVENQEAADKRIPQFLTVPLACRGLSMEPLLGAVDLIIGHDYMKHDVLRGSLKSFNSDGQCKTETGGEKISWLIIGGESGANARLCNVDWIRSIVQQGNAAGVATFVKQLGANSISEVATVPDRREWRKTKVVTDRAGLLDKKGGDPSEWPLDLREQKWPKGF